MGYVWGLVVIAFLAVGGMMYKYRGDAIHAEAEAAKARVALEQAVAVNKTNAETIKRMEEEEAKNAVDQAELAEERERINNALQAINRSLFGLKETNENVRDYLNTPVPDDLRKLYDTSPSGGD